MVAEIKDIVVVGGGSAGWLSAAIIAADNQKYKRHSINITLIESENVATLGVGEGTWPSMRTTLKKIGIRESDFIRCCDASFKQASQFVNWRQDNEKDEYYFHPFSLPTTNTNINHKDNVVHYWLNQFADTQTTRQNIPMAFADTVGYQAKMCEKNLAPKLASTDEYSFIANYGYHLDAAKFGQLLKQHCIDKLSVKHVIAHVTGVNAAENGDIESIATDLGTTITADLFIDCTGSKSLLLGEHYNIGFISQKHCLLNDSALAVQVPIDKTNSEIKSATISTAQDCGWIWDIGLQSRRGVGYVYASEYTSKLEAEAALKKYLSSSLSKHQINQLNFKSIHFNPGYRQKLWHKNCVAVGMSAGFIEPLEASALALVEVAANYISQQLPVNREHMELVSTRFNQKMLAYWQQIIEFLKLHYVLSKRSASQYWIDQRDENTIPVRLKALLKLWKYQTPTAEDIPLLEPLFPAASYQYILYGMGFNTQMTHADLTVETQEIVQNMIKDNINKQSQLQAIFPTNRALINCLTQSNDNRGFSAND